MNGFMESLESRQMLALPDALVNEDNFIDDVSPEQSYTPSVYFSTMAASPIQMTSIVSPMPPTNIMITTSRVYVNGVSKGKFVVKFRAGVVPSNTQLIGYMINIVHNNRVQASLRVGVGTAIAITGNFTPGEKYYVKLATIAKYTQYTNKMSEFNGVWATAK